MFIVSIVLAVLIIGGTSTAVLADSAKPGDALYPVDQVMESIQNRMSKKQTTRANFLAKISNERAQELLQLKNINPTQLDAKLKARLERLQTAAIDRLAVSIEKVEAVKVKFQEKLTLAENEAQAEAYRKVISNLEAVAAKRQVKLEAIQAGDAPFLKKMQERLRMSVEGKAQIRAEIAKEFPNPAPVTGNSINSITNSSG